MESETRSEPLYSGGKLLIQKPLALKEDTQGSGFDAGLLCWMEFVYKPYSLLFIYYLATVYWSHRLLFL